MDWAARRRFFYLSVMGLFIGTIAVLMFRHTLVQAPSCFDGKQNGDETGTDCGGSCARYCPATLALPTVQWARTFPITAGFAHAVAYLENNYPNAGIRNVQYQFSLFDANNELITSRSGSTFIAGVGHTVIIEPLIQIGNQVPVVTRFSITGADNWEKLPTTVQNVTLKTDRTSLEELATTTRLTAVLSNTGTMPLANVPVVAILYDAQDNAITASKTEILSVAPGEQIQAYFTWPFILSQSVARIEIVPRINPFSLLQND